MFELVAEAPPDDEVVEGAATGVVAVVAPELGGRIAALTVAGRALLITGDADRHPMMWGAFPMVPWAGRVRHGRFWFDGVEHQLRVEQGPHALHGTGYRTVWEVTERDERGASLVCELDWEFGGTAHQRFDLTAESLTCRLAVVAGDVPMPAELGWHPWFVEPRTLHFTPSAMYARDQEGIPDGRLVEPKAGPWDDCFVNTDPVHLVHDQLVVTLRSDCDDWVVYDEPEGAVCVEPQSGPPDAFNLRPRRLEPGEALERTLLISWG